MNLMKLAAVLACVVPMVANASPKWDWQLTEPFNLSRTVAYYDIDPDNHTKAKIAALVKRGVKPICYISVGTLEDSRRDVASFPAKVLGKIYDDWPHERFLDIRQVKILLPIMQKRFQRCKDMGFTHVEPDNQDVYTNDSGFPITAAQTVTYLMALADMAHKMGLKIGQKNVSELTPKLVAKFDFIVTEGCFVDGWCAQVKAYAKAKKPIFAAEYTDTPVNFAAACSWGAGRGFSFILKDRDLTMSRKGC